MTITSLSLPSGGMGCKAVPKLSGVRTLCWILLDTDDFNQQQNIFCNAMVRQRQAGCHTGVTSPLWCAAGQLSPSHQLSSSNTLFASLWKIVDFLTSNVTLTSDCVLMWCHPDLWLCPDVDRQAVRRTASHPTPCPISRESESLLHSRRTKI